MFSLSTDQVIWAIGAVVAVSMLISMLNRRQNELRKLLKAHVEDQIEWASKRSAALKMAKRAALAREAADRAAERELLAAVEESEMQPAESNSNEPSDANVELF